MGDFARRWQCSVLRSALGRGGAWPAPVAVRKRTIGEHLSSLNFGSVVSGDARAQREVPVPYSKEDLDRRLQLARELLSPYPPRQLTSGLENLTLSGPGRQLDIAFPAGLAPKTKQGMVGNPDDALPHVDVAVLTYTVDESKALADVLTPGHFAPDWAHYTRGFASYLPKIRNGAPARMEGRLASYWQTAVGNKSVLVVKSELHMNQDSHLVDGKPTLPILDFFKQVLSEAQPQHFFCIGTAGGLYPDKPLGTVAASRAVRFMCEKDFKSQPFANEEFQSDWTVPTTHRETALALMKPFLANLAVPANSAVSSCPCKALQGTRVPKADFLLDGHAGIPAFHPVLTTDFFEFGTDKNQLDKLGMAVEMDDAVFGLAASQTAKPPRWASIRNYSDPAINSLLTMKKQEDCATQIYMHYGYWTSVLGAIATWSIIAGL
jgi:hypothetical protein